MWLTCNTRTTRQRNVSNHPRPFGCGLRASTEPCPQAQRRIAEVVTVGSVRTRTVVDLGQVFSSFVTGVATTTSGSEPTQNCHFELAGEESSASVLRDSAAYDVGGAQPRQRHGAKTKSRASPCGPSHLRVKRSLCRSVQRKAAHPAEVEKSECEL